ncbi:MAG: MFS transporter [Bacteroidales bacterium]|nr:MFS transporter [Bacteroidales bacterium]
MQSFKTSKLYAWIVVGLLWVVALLNYMDRQMLSTMKEAMAVDIVELQSAEAFGVLMAAFLWIYGFASPWAGFVADRLNRKWLIVVSLFVWSAVTLAMGLTHDFHTIYVLRMVMGVSEAMYIPAALALIADYHKGGSRSLAIGVHMTGLYVGQALGGYGAVFSKLFSWNDTFFYFGLIGAIYAIVLAFCLFETEEHIARIKQPVQSGQVKGLDFRAFGHIFTTPAFWIIILFFTMSSIPGWATKNWLPTLFATNLGIGMEEAGPLSTITIAASSFAGVFIGGAVSDWWVHRNIRGRVYTSALGFGLMIPSLLLLAYGHTLLEVVGGGVLFGIGLGLFDTNNMPIVCQYFAPRYRSTAYGLMNMAGVLAGAAITEVLGKLKETMGDRFGESFVYMAIGVAVVALIQLIGLKPTTDDKQD